MNKYIVQKNEVDRKKLSHIADREVNAHVNMDQIEDHELITIISGRSQKSSTGFLGVASATLKPLIRDSTLFIRTCVFVLTKEDLNPTTLGEGLYNQLTNYAALQITSKEEAEADSAKALCYLTQNKPRVRSRI